MLLTACAAPSRDLPAVPVEPLGPASRAADFSGAGWRMVTLPGKRSTVYRPEMQDGRVVLHAQAEQSVSMWRRQVNLPASSLQSLRFSWRVPQLIEEADLSDRDNEDAPVRVVLAFDGDHGKLGLRDRMLFDLAETLTGERPPYATLMYVWDTRAPVGSVIRASRTDRIRKLVLESGPGRLGQWLSYERDVVADYRRLFGEEPGRLIGVAVMTDADNTGSRTEAWYGPIDLVGRDSLALY